MHKVEKMTGQTARNPGLMTRRLILGTTVAGAIAFFIFGIIFWGGFNTAMEATNNLEFCISCHEMEENVYQEYKPTIHYSNRTGVRATCPDCHVPDPWVHKVVRKIQASNELFHKIIGTVDTPEKFNDHRLTMARRVWKAMKTTDSRECRNCHNLESMNPEFQQPRARKQHLNAFNTGQTCIDCHKGIAHKDVRELLSDEEIEEIEAPNPDYIREVPHLFLAGMQRVEEKEAEKAAQEEAERAQAMQAAPSAPTGGAAPAAAGDGFGVNWAAVPSRKITVFYPGETSMEWVLTGKDHGGARPFTKAGDRCTTCHDKETAEMGEKMVTGEKAESTPIPGKRGSIPVMVQAAHDDDSLYLRFEWPDTAHHPVPFVDGGKMDPDNPVKLAVMLATDDVEYADRAGCWGTCHHDAKTMPDTPDAGAIGASEAAGRIDLANGVTKYIGESRTGIEVKGRRGKQRGGWDKLKGADELAAEMAAGRFMDLIRYKAGEAVAESGHVLEQRVLNADDNVLVSAGNAGGNWVMVFKRKLQSDRPDGLSLDKGRVYNLGFAIHDDYASSRFHHVSLGYRLAFDNDGEGIEINAVKQ